MCFEFWTKCFRVVTPAEAAVAIGDSLCVTHDTVSVILYADDCYMTRDADGVITLDIENMGWTAEAGDLEQFNRLEEELYDWWGMFHDDDEQKLHAIALAYMNMRPDLSPMSLDEWLVEHGDKLTPTHKALGHDILAEFYAA